MTEQKKSYLLDLLAKTQWRYCFIAALFALFSLNGYAQNYRIDATQLQQLMAQNPQLKILDANDKGSYQLGHLPNALNLPTSATYLNQDIDGRVQVPPVMQKILRSLGLQREHEIVVYDNGQMMQAARLLWVLNVYGFEKVQILDKGMTGWKQAGFSLSKEKQIPEQSDYIATINHHYLATKFAIELAIKTPDTIIIDARSEKAYRGETSTAQRFGHIPGAINIPANHNYNRSDEANQLTQSSALAKLYGRFSKDKQLIIYCDIGLASSSTYLALKELGYKVSNYDASWKQWSNDISLPVENETVEGNH